MESRLGVLLQAFVLLWRRRRQPHRRRHRVHRAHRADMRDAVASVKRALSPRLVIMFGVCNIVYIRTLVFLASRGKQIIPFHDFHPTSYTENYMYAPAYAEEIASGRSLTDGLHHKIHLRPKVIETLEGICMMSL